MMLETLLALVVATTPPAPDPAPEYRRNPHFVRGSRAFTAGRFAEAADAFELAYDAAPHTELLWAWAQAVRLAGRCQAAIELYRRYLATDPATTDVEDARSNIRLCGGDPDAPVAIESTPPPPVVPPEADLPPPPPAPRRPIEDPLGHTLTWPGLAIAGAGAAMLSVAHVRRDRAEAAGDEAGYRNALRGAPALSQAGIAVLTVGGALLTAGIVRFTVLAVRARKAARRR